MKNYKLAFVGLGRMGGNMARCLKEQGYNLSAVYDINRNLTRELAGELDARACDTLEAVTANADIIFTVITDDKAMEAIYFGPDNLLACARGRLFINCATLTPAIHSRVAEAVAKSGAGCLEACMASSIPQARAGELFLMIGGDEALFQQYRPLLEAISKSLHYVGPIGRASQVKALVNMVMNINTAGLAEGLGLGQALGLDLGMLCDIFRQTGAHSRVLDTDATDMISRDHDCYFSAEHAAKDSGIAMNLAESHGVEVPLARATLRQYRKMVDLGLGQLDKSGISELTFPGRLPGRK